MPGRAMEASPRSPRLALIGAGRWGRNVIETVRRLPGVTLAAVASRNHDTARHLPRGCRIVPDWRALLDDGAIDGLIVATPPATHAEIAQAALCRDLPLLIEKPLTMALPEAEALWRTANERARPIVLVDHIHLFAPAWSALKDNLWRIGRIDAVESAGTNHGPFRAHSPVLWDYAPHDIALCLDLAGDAPRAISARRMARASFPDGDGEAIAIHLSFAAGWEARIQVSNIADRKTRRLTVIGTEGRLTYDDTTDDKLVFEPRHGKAMPLPFGAARPLDCVIRAFADAIGSGGAAITDLRMGLGVVSVLAACEAALAGGQQGCAPRTSPGAPDAA